MRIELAPPGSMEGHLDLHTALAQAPQVTHELFRMVDNGHDITELEPSEEENEAFIEHIECLREAFFPYQDYNEGSLTVYRSLAFTRRLGAQLIKEAEIKGDYSHIPKHLDDNGFQQFAASLSQDYLTTRPQLDLTIDNFMHLISPDSDFRPGAKLVAAFQLVAIDRHLQQDFSQRVLGDYTLNVRNWDGLLTEFDT